MKMTVVAAKNILAECQGQSVMAKTTVTTTTVLAECQGQSVMAKTAVIATTIPAEYQGQSLVGMTEVTATTIPAECQPVTDRNDRGDCCNNTSWMPASQWQEWQRWLLQQYQLNASQSLTGMTEVTAATIPAECQPVSDRNDRGDCYNNTSWMPASQWQEWLRWLLQQYQLNASQSLTGMTEVTAATIPAECQPVSDRNDRGDCYNNTSWMPASQCWERQRWRLQCWLDALGNPWQETQMLAECKGQISAWKDSVDCQNAGLMPRVVTSRKDWDQFYNKDGWLPRVLSTEKDSGLLHNNASCTSARKESGDCQNAGLVNAKRSHFRERQRSFYNNDGWLPRTLSIEKDSSPLHNMSCTSWLSSEEAAGKNKSLVQCWGTALGSNQAVMGP